MFRASAGLLLGLRRGFVGGDERVPDWVTQTFEWGDGSLSELADRS